MPADPAGFASMSFGMSVSRCSSVRVGEDVPFATRKPIYFLLIPANASGNFMIKPRLRED
jgi:hypothetical protein